MFLKPEPFYEAHNEKDQTMATQPETLTVPADAQPFRRSIEQTTRRVLSRRAVMWLGQTCNLRCYFCYFANRIADFHHPEHPFMTLDKAKEICKIVREFYGCTSIDIQGGEPTIFPDILELVHYCREIGLAPTLITNGLALARREDLEPYIEAGIRDFLVSLHGVGEVHDQVVGREGAAEACIHAIANMQELGIPFRINCTMSAPVVPQLAAVAEEAARHGALAVNFIAFNPFCDQATEKRTAQNVPKYSDVKHHLTAALDVLDAAGIEANVRYLPFCMAEERHRKSWYNFQQLPYDLHEWDFASWQWTMLQPQMMQQGGLVPAFHIACGGRVIYRRRWGQLMKLFEKQPKAGVALMVGQHVLGKAAQALQGKERLYRNEAKRRAEEDCHYRYHGACEQCALRPICDGFHGDYADMFGTVEAQPVTDLPRINDSLHFISQQQKVVLDEDQDWAL